MVIKSIVQKKACLLTREIEIWISCSVFLITKSLTLDTPHDLSKFWFSHLSRMVVAHVFTVLFKVH